MIRIIIERNILDGKLDDYHALIRQAKNKASNIPGFLSGEIFHVKDNRNQVVVMSCQDLLDDMRPLLESDEKVMVLQASHLKKD